MSTASISYAEYAEQEDAPPLAQNVAAEQALLGACMAQSDAVTSVAALVKVEHFYRPAHQTIYACIVELFDNGQPTDTITVSAELGRRQELVRVGSGPYLHTLVESAPVVAESLLRSWATEVRSSAAIRKLGELGGAFSAHAAVHTAHVDEVKAVLERATEQVATATEWLRADEAERPTALGDHLAQALLNVEDRAVNGVQQGILTGFADLDAVTNGLHPGQLVVMGARPGVGKSTLAVDVARSAAIGQNVPSGILSMEMDEQEISERVLAAEASVRLGDIRKGTLVADDWKRLHSTVQRVQGAPLHVLDVSGATITDLRAQARKMVRQHGIRLLVVDYLQLIESQGKAENRQIEVSGFSRKLKLLGKELGLPVVLVAQLNRGPETRQDHKPQMSDLRESGGIENDADMVILINRPDAYERDDPRMGEADLILAKHRAGPTATVTVAHQLHYSRFIDMESEGLSWEARFAQDAAPSVEASSAAGADPQPALCGGCRDVLGEDAEDGFHPECRVEAQGVLGDEG